TPNHCLASRRVPKDVCCSDPGCKVEPGGPPQWCSLGSKLQRVGRGAFHRIWNMSVCRTRSGIKFPAHSQRKIEPRPYSPFILGEGREIDVNGMGSSFSQAESVVHSICLNRTFAVELIIDEGIGLV